MHNHNTSKKMIEYESMKELYEIAYQSAMNTLFKVNFNKHGWRYDDYMEIYNEEQEIVDFMINPNATVH